MENASKALIIAGAILISIIIIGLGVYFVNMAQSAGRRVNLDSQAAQAQNNQFEAYFGDKKTATEVKSLMSLIRTNNITGETGSETNKIYVFLTTKGTGAVTDALTDPNQVAQKVKAGKTYSVWQFDDKADDVVPTSKANAKGYYTSGFLKVITVKEN